MNVHLALLAEGYQEVHMESMVIRTLLFAAVMALVSGMLTRIGHSSKEEKKDEERWAIIDREFVVFEEERV